MFDRVLVQELRGIGDIRGRRRMAVGVRNHSARLYLYPTDCRAAVLCSPLAKAVEAVEVWMSVSEKMHTGRTPKATQRVQNSPQHALQPPRGRPTRKLGQGLSRFRCNLPGSPEITLSDLTETQRKAFRVQVWFHQYCVNGLLSSQKESRIAGEMWGFGDN